MMIKRSNRGYGELKGSRASSYTRLNKPTMYLAVLFTVLVASVFVVGGVVSYAQSGDGNQTEYTGDSGDGIKVTAKADAGTFPEGTTLKITRVTKDGETSADYASAKSALDESGTSYDGFAAVDISFVDPKGNEVEPADGKAVSVTLTADDSVVPEDADPSSLAVSHIDESGAQPRAHAVADASTQTDGSVDSSDGSVKAEFKADSFSTYTITWSSTNSNFPHPHFVVTVHYVDESGNEIGSTSDSDNLTFGAGNYETKSYVFPTSKNAKVINGYSFNHVTYGSVSGSTITRATYNVPGRGTEGNLTFYNGDSVVAVATLTSNGSTGVVGADVYLVYKDNSALKITDNVKEDGTFVANYSAALADGQTYRWVRSASENGKYSPVESKRVSGKSYNVDPADPSKINVVLDGHDDETQHYWYKVQIVNADGTVAQVSHPKQVTYNYQLMNGSFEKPVVTGSYNHQYSNKEYLDNGGYWQTTGLGSGNMLNHDIEIVSTTQGKSGERQYQFHTNDALYPVQNGNQAPDGNQFAELNCEASGSLYQDVMSVPGSQLTYSLVHRARGNVQDYNKSKADQYKDTMYVLIMSSKLADELNIKTQDDVNDAISKINAGDPAYAGAKVVPYTDPMVWTLHSADYTVPSGQYLTRFFFVAGDTASGDPTVGNLIDDVSFSSNVPAPVNGGNLEVSKTVNGLSDAEMANYSVTVKVEGKDSHDKAVELSHNFSDFEHQTDGSYKQTYTFQELDPGTYTVTETVNSVSSDLNGYEASSTINGHPGKSSKIEVKEKKTANADFANTYTHEPVKLTISKTVTGNMGDKTQAFGFTLIVVGYTKNLVDIGNDNIAITNKGNGTYGFQLTDGQSVTVSLPHGARYTVTENDPNKSDDSLQYKTTYAVGNEAAIEGRVYAAKSGLTSDTTVRFTNSKSLSSPDTGVNTGSSLPYAVGLGSVATGAAFLLAKRRRGNDW